MTPITGAQRRSLAVPFSAMPLMTSTVARALSGAASTGCSSGAFISRSLAYGITVMGISMMTVPDTVGVRMR